MEIIPLRVVFLIGQRVKSLVNLAEVPQGHSPCFKGLWHDFFPHHGLKFGRGHPYITGDVWQAQPTAWWDDGWIFRGRDYGLKARFSSP
jgi:hypothetical protein